MVNIDKIVNYSAGTCLLQVLDKKRNASYDIVNRFIQSNEYDPDILLEVDESTVHAIKLKVIDRIREYCIENRIELNIGNSAIELLNSTN